MNKPSDWHEPVVTSALLRHAHATYGMAMRRALENEGYDDIPRNGMYVIGGLAMGEGNVPLGDLIRQLRVSKQAASQLVDTLVTRGYLQRTEDEHDRRRLVVTLTERGHAAAKIQAKIRKILDQRLTRSVGTTNLEITRRTLAALIDLGRQDSDDT